MKLPSHFGKPYWNNPSGIAEVFSHNTKPNYKGREEVMADLWCVVRADPQWGFSRLLQIPVTDLKPFTLYTLSLIKSSPLACPISLIFFEHNFWKLDTKIFSLCFSIIRPSYLAIRWTKYIVSCTSCIILNKELHPTWAIIEQSKFAQSNWYKHTFIWKHPLPCFWF